MNIINTQSYLEEGVVALDLQLRSRLLAAMAVAVDGLRLCRVRKLTRDSHARQYREHPETFKAKAKSFRESEQGRAYYSEYERHRRKSSPYYHFLNWLRGDINRSLRKQHAAKGGRTEELVGCPFEKLRDHIASQFTQEMSWAQRNFDVDHFVPISAFDLRDVDEQRCAFNWRNMRPMPPLANKQKGATIPNPLPSWLPPHIAERILARVRQRRPSLSTGAPSPHP